MTPHARRTTRIAAAVAGVAVAAVIAVPAPAFARPLPKADRYAMYAGGTYTVDPLDNDDISFLSSGALSLCGIRGVDTDKLYVVQSGDSLTIEVRDGIRGSSQITYDACQGNQRATSTITIAIAQLVDLSGVRKPNTKGKVLFTNRNDVAVQVTYGSDGSGRPDATRTVPAGRSITVATSRPSLYWVGLYSDDGVQILVGDNSIYKVQVRTTK
jgi:hypothetical protein